MFLALKEILYAKSRYVLIAGVIFLISYLVFFLTGLAYRLAYANRTGVDSWRAKGIVISSAGNKNLMGSSISRSISSSVLSEDKADLVAMNAVILKNELDSAENKIDSIFFGVDYNSFIFLKITDGRMIEAENEVVADDTIRIKEGLKIGDTIKL